MEANSTTNNNKNNTFETTNSVTPIVSTIKKNKLSETTQSVIDFFSGSVAGLIGKLIEYPFDTVKVRLQTDTRYKGPIDCFKQSLKADGYKSLYRGVSAPIVGSMLENSLMFMSYKQAQALIKKVLDRDTLDIRHLVTAGAMSGFLTSTVLTPIELVKCQTQVAIKQNKSPFVLFKKTLIEKGFKGIYKGHLSTSIREIGGNASWFGTYEISLMIFKNLCNKERDNLHPLVFLTSGAFAGIGYNFSFFPVDAIKSNMQTNTNSSYLNIARNIYHQNGIAGFYRGCGITIFRAIPSNAVIFYTYELVSKNTTGLLLST